MSVIGIAVLSIAFVVGEFTVMSMLPVTLMRLAVALVMPVFVIRIAMVFVFTMRELTMVRRTVVRVMFRPRSGWRRRRRAHRPTGAHRPAGVMVARPDVCESGAQLASLLFADDLHHAFVQLLHLLHKQLVKLARLLGARNPFDDPTHVVDVC